MSEFLRSSSFFALTASLLGFELGLFLRKKTGIALFSPLLTAIAAVIGLLLIFRIDYSTYEEGSRVLSYMLTPATVALAVPLYRRLDILKKNPGAIFAGVSAGAAASLLCTLALAVLFRFSHTEYVTFLPKSITTAIGMGMSEELGGTVTITVAAIVVTGIVGSMMGDLVCRLFRIQEKVAIGLALGTSAHVIGTAKALELGEIPGAMSSLSIVVAGLFTVLAANFFALLY